MWLNWLENQFQWRLSVINKQIKTKPGFLNSIIIFVFERIDDLISLKYSAVHCTVQYLIQEEAIPLTNLTKHMTHTDCYAASGLDYIKWINFDIFSHDFALFKARIYKEGLTERAIIPM